jgi:hypothetical protein
MRGDSEWSVGERELFAAYTSHLITCRSRRRHSEVKRSSMRC